VSAAADQVKKHAPSILEQPAYQVVMKRLGDHPAGTVEFCNLPVTAPDSYANLLMLSRLYLGGADMLGVHPPAMVIPPLSKIVPELSPCGGISWTDSMGLHMKSICPFPGSELIASSDVGSTAMVGEAAIMTSVMLPALGKSRDAAKRAVSMSNERQLGLGLIMYANDHQGKLPDDVGAVLPYVRTPKLFISPSKTAAIPANFDAMTKDDKEKWINDNTDYEYLGKGLGIRGTASRILLYEKDGAHQPRGMNLLFGDGHVEFQTTEAAKKLIQEQEGGL
jgi:prepilin-type processing-associated H-X9-DG protein